MNFRLCPQFRAKLFPAGKKCLVGDNGVDPVLGPPFPPVHYQLFIDAFGQPRLTWTVPELILFFDPADPMNGDPSGGGPSVTATYQMYVTNAVFPPWDAGTTYIYNDAASINGNRYRSRIDNNINKQPDLFGALWEQDDTFWVLYLKTVNTVTGLSVDFQPVLDSDGFTYGYDPADFIFVGATFNYFGDDLIPYMPFAVQRESPSQLHELYFYVSATSTVGGATAFSDIQKFLIDL